MHGRAIALEIDNLHRELETLGQNGKWSELAAVMKRRDELLSKVPDIDRAIIFRAALRINERTLWCGAMRSSSFSILKSGFFVSMVFCFSVCDFMRKFSFVFGY